MKNKIKSDIQRYIRLNLEDRIYQIVSNADKVRLLSKRDLISIVKFMKKNKIYSRNMLEYIYTKSIYRHCCDLPDLDNNILIDAAREGNLDVVKFLLSDDIRILYPKLDPCADNNYAIGSASRYGHLDVVKFLLSRKIRKLFPKIDPSDNNNFAIGHASIHGHLDVLEFLLSNEIRTLYPNIDPSVKDNIAIRRASMYGHIDVVKFLLSDDIRKLYPSINPSAHDNFAIKHASECGHLDVVEFLRINVYNSAPLFDILENKI